ncbi:MAG: MATE family efflux transporter [Clostridiales bacterium]|nr:MATE family efflux transporter [Clostridiales bacterium]
MFIRMDKSSLKALNKFAIPLIVQNIACMSIGLIDEMFIGRISAEAYGAIGIAISLMNLMAGVFGSIAVAFNIIGSKKQGEENTEEFREVFMASLLVDIIIGIVYGIATVVCCKMVYIKLYGLSGAALDAAVVYSYITCPYMLFQLVIFSCNSYYKIMKNTSRLMLFSTGSAILNTVLDYILIFGKFGFPKLNAMGAAIATIVSVFVNMLVLVWAARKDIAYFWNKNKRYLENAKELIKVNLPLLGEELLEGSVFVVVINAIISNIGINEIGAYLLVKNILEIALLSMHMYGSATLTLISEKIGRRAYEEIKKLSVMSATVSSSIYAVLAIAVVVFRKDVPRIISDDMNLIAFAGGIIIPMVVMNIFNPIQTIYKYALQACGDGKYVLYITALVNAVVLAAIVALYMLGGRLWAVFIGLFINYSALAVVYMGRLKKVVEKIRV